MTHAETLTPAAVPATGGYVSLHTHTEFSPQDGLARLDDLMASVAADGQPAVAMTDHGSTAGAWKFVKAAKKHGLKPILGLEAYVALVPDGSDGGEAMDPLDPRVRFAKFAREGMDAESGKKKRNTNNHLTILVENETGWRNLCRISNAAEDSFYYKPLIDYALLKEHAEGLIVLSGCLGGPVASLVAMARTDVRDERGNVVDVVWDEAILDRARAALALLIECVGRENVYVEIMEHGLASEGWQHIVTLARLAKEAGVEVVATNDSHYVDSCDCHAHDAWLVAGEHQRGNKVALDDPDRWRFNGSGYWMRTEAEMRALYPEKAGWQRAVDNTMVIANRVAEDVIPFKPLRLPTFPVPEAFAQPEAKSHLSRSAAYLHAQALAGAKRLYGTPMPAEVKERMGFEFGVITGMGLEDYFLIVADVIEWARSERGLPTAEHPDGTPAEHDAHGKRIEATGKAPILVGPGRGSAAGSAISYCLGIVMVDPLENGLLFERFLDVERVGMPDIDVDFEAARRDEIYAYLAAKYGEEYVARIGAFQVAKTKRAIKDAARVMGKGPLGETIAKLVPVKQGAPQTFAQLFEEVLDKETGSPVQNPEASKFRALVANDPEVAAIVALARSFEGVAAGNSIHAAGVIISDEPLPSLIPMRHLREKATGKRIGVPVALWDGKDIDDFGMLKLDALGLINLDIVAAAVRHIESTTGEVVDPDALPHPNTEGNTHVSAAYGLIREGRTQGVFQLASDGMTELATQVGPTRFGDLSALVALYRPGPMGADMHTLYADRKNGRAGVDYSIYTTDLAEQQVIRNVLDDTYGVICFQESLMQLAQDVSGFTAAEKNKLRKAFSKKDRPAMEALKATFIDQGQQQMTLPNGVEKIAFSRATLEGLWRTFDASAEYLFNASHSAAYGHLAYVTAYLKAGWPTQYGAAILSVIDDPKKRLPILKALTKEGITLEAPDINLSGVHTAPDPDRDGVVRIGLSEIRDVGSAAKHILTARESGGPFASMADVVARVKIPGTDKEGNPVQNRIGALALEGLIEAGAFDCFGPRMGHMEVARAVGDCLDAVVPDSEWGALEKANRQRFRLGITTGESPLETYRDFLDAHKPSMSFHEGGDTASQDPVLVDAAVAAGASAGVPVTGLLVEWTPRTTRAGKTMARFVLQGHTETIDGIAFPSTYEGWVADGIEPSPGSIVTVLGEVRRTTMTVERETQTVNEDGDVVSVTAEHDIDKTELIANGIVEVPVENAPQHSLPGIVEAPENEKRAPDLSLVPPGNVVRIDFKKAIRDSEFQVTMGYLGSSKSSKSTAKASGPAPDNVRNLSEKAAEKAAEKAKQTATQPKAPAAQAQTPVTPTPSAPATPQSPSALRHPHGHVWWASPWEPLNGSPVKETPIHELSPAADPGDVSDFFWEADGEAKKALMTVCRGIAFENDSNGLPLPRVFKVTARCKCHDSGAPAPPSEARPGRYGLQTQLDTTKIRASTPLKCQELPACGSGTRRTAYLIIATQQRAAEIEAAGLHNFVYEPAATFLDDTPAPDSQMDRVQVCVNPDATSLLAASRAREVAASPEQTAATQ